MDSQWDLLEPDWGWVLPEETKIQVDSRAESSGVEPIEPHARKQPAMASGEEEAGHGPQRTRSLDAPVRRPLWRRALREALRLVIAIVLGFVVAFSALTVIPALREKWAAGYVGFLWCVFTIVVWVQSSRM